MSLGKHGVIRNFILNMIWLAFAVGAAVCFTAGEGHLLFGAFIYILLITAVLVFNLFPARKWLKAEYTTCYVGGLPSDEYFALRENGASELEIRRKMVDALTVMQKEAREKAAREEADALRKRAERR